MGLTAGQNPLVRHCACHLRLKHVSSPNRTKLESVSLTLTSWRHHFTKYISYFL